MFRSLLRIVFGLEKQSGVAEATLGHSRPDGSLGISGGRQTGESGIPGQSVVLYAHVDAPMADNLEASHRQGKGQSKKKRPLNHRHWILSMQMKHLKLCSSRRCETLARAGIVTAADLVACDIEKLGHSAGAPVSAVRALKRYRQAIKLAASVSGMMPLDAVLLFSIHRRSVEGLAKESPVSLYRDLQRFALSTRGQRLLRGRRLPSVKRLRRWITTCNSMRSLAAQAPSADVPTEKTLASRRYQSASARSVLSPDFKRQTELSSGSFA